MLYVHIDEQNKPWIDKVSTEKLDGYEAKPGLLDNQIIALMNFPDKCYVDDNGVVVTPNQLPLSEAEKQSQQSQLQLEKMQSQIKDMQSDINTLSIDKATLQAALNSANADNNNLKQQIQNVQKQSLAYMNQLAQINAELAKYKQSQSSQGGDK